MKASIRCSSSLLQQLYCKRWWDDEVIALRCYSWQRRPKMRPYDHAWWNDCMHDHMIDDMLILDGMITCMMTLMMIWSCLIEWLHAWSHDRWQAHPWWNDCIHDDMIDDVLILDGMIAYMMTWLMTCSSLMEWLHAWWHNWWRAILGFLFLEKGQFSLNSWKCDRWTDWQIYSYREVKTHLKICSGLSPF